MSLEEKYIVITEGEEDEEEAEDIREAATSIVGGVIKDAVDQIVALQKEEAGTPRCSIQNAKYYLDETWELHESWLHWSNYLNNQELQYSTQYYYRVRWSIPTCRKPIPRATACVYFVIEISKIKPKVRSHTPINWFKHLAFHFAVRAICIRPGKTRFKEKWLKDVIESKIVMMETILRILDFDSSAVWGGECLYLKRIKSAGFGDSKQEWGQDISASAQRCQGPLLVRAVDLVLFPQTDRLHSPMPKETDGRLPAATHNVAGFLKGSNFFAGKADLASPGDPFACLDILGHGGTFTGQQSVSVASGEKEHA
ncbi:hypothetical protein E2320_013066, partial [Naja naja]